MMFVRELQLTYNIACNAIKCKSNRGKMRKNDRRNRDLAVVGLDFLEKERISGFYSQNSYVFREFIPKSLVCEDDGASGETFF